MVQLFIDLGFESKTLSHQQKMAASAAQRKRKREIQDENMDLKDNFTYLRYLGEQKRRRMHGSSTETKIVSHSFKKSHFMLC